MNDTTRTPDEPDGPVVADDQASGPSDRAATGRSHRKRRGREGSEHVAAAGSAGKPPTARRPRRLVPRMRHGAPSATLGRRNRRARGRRLGNVREPACRTRRVAGAGGRKRTGGRRRCQDTAEQEPSAAPTPPEGQRGCPCRIPVAVAVRLLAAPAAVSSAAQTSPATDVRRGGRSRGADRADAAADHQRRQRQRRAGNPTGRPQQPRSGRGADAGPGRRPPRRRGTAFPGRSPRRCSSRAGRPRPSRTVEGPTAFLEPPAPPSSDQQQPKADRTPGAARPSRGGRARPPRQASLQLKRLDPWSVLKLALVLAVVLFLIWLVAVGVLYGVLDGIGVWDRLNGTYADLVSGEAPSGSPLISAGRVFGIAAVVGADQQPAVRRGRHGGRFRLQRVGRPGRRHRGHAVRAGLIAGVSGCRRSETLG